MEERRCAYVSERGKCRKNALDGAQFCIHHSCPHSSCKKSKGSREPHCGNPEHAPGAVPPPRQAAPPSQPSRPHPQRSEKPKKAKKDTRGPRPPKAEAVSVGVHLSTKKPAADEDETDGFGFTVIDDQEHADSMKRSFYGNRTEAAEKAIRARNQVYSAPICTECERNVALFSTTEGETRCFQCLPSKNMTAMRKVRACCDKSSAARGRAWCAPSFHSKKSLALSFCFCFGLAHRRFARACAFAHPHRPSPLKEADPTWEGVCRLWLQMCPPKIVSIA